MPDQIITNASSAFGQAGQLGVRDLPMVNGSTTTVEAFSVVGLSTVSAASPGTLAFVSPSTSAVTNVIGIVQKDVAVGASAMVRVEGISLVAVSSGAIPAVGDLLSSSTVASGAANSPQTIFVKTTTAATPIGSVIGYCLSTALDTYVSTSTATAVGVFVPAYIHKM